MRRLESIRLSTPTDVVFGSFLGFKFYRLSFANFCPQTFGALFGAFACLKFFIPALFLYVGISNIQLVSDTKIAQIHIHFLDANIHLQTLHINTKAHHDVTHCKASS